MNSTLIKSVWYQTLKIIIQLTWSENEAINHKNVQRINYIPLRIKIKPLFLNTLSLDSFMQGEEIYRTI